MISRGFIAALAALCAAATSAAAETSIERGSYLVNAVMVCDGCHTPRGPSGLNMERRFSGGSIVWDGPAYTVQGSNITADRDTGIGTWSEDDIKRLLTTGVRPNSPLHTSSVSSNRPRIFRSRTSAALARSMSADLSGRCFSKFSVTPPW